MDEQDFKKFDGLFFNIRVATVAAGAGLLGLFFNLNWLPENLRGYFFALCAVALLYGSGVLFLIGFSRLFDFIRSFLKDRH